MANPNSQQKTTTFVFGYNSLATLTCSTLWAITKKVNTKDPNSLPSFYLRTEALMKSPTKVNQWDIHLTVHPEKHPGAKNAHVKIEGHDYPEEWNVNIGSPPFTLARIGFDNTLARHPHQPVSFDNNQIDPTKIVWMQTGEPVDKVIAATIMITKTGDQIQVTPAPDYAFRYNNVLDGYDVIFLLQPIDRDVLRNCNGTVIKLTKIPNPNANFASTKIDSTKYDYAVCVYDVSPAIPAPDGIPLLLFCLWDKQYDHLLGTFPPPNKP